MSITKDFDALVALSGYEKKLIISQRRNKLYVKARQIIAKTLRSAGYSYPEIGRVMNRDHSSIQHLCKYRKKDID